MDIDFSPFAAVAKLLYESAFVAERYSGIRSFLEKDQVTHSSVLLFCSVSNVFLALLCWFPLLLLSCYCVLLCTSGGSTLQGVYTLQPQARNLFAFKL